MAIKILIADDEKLICEWLEFCIKERPDFEIVGIADNGVKALELFQLHEPDIVLSDIKMPVMDGLELLKEIRNRNDSTYIIMLTAFSDFAYVRQSMRESANEYILKTEMNSQLLHDMLDRIAAKINDEKKNFENNIQYNGQKHILLRDVLSKDQPLTENDINQLKDIGIRWRNNGIFVLATWKKQFDQEFSFTQHEYVKHVVGTDYDDHIFLVIGNLAQEKTDLDKMYLLHEYANLLITQNHCMIGLSRISDSLVNLNETVLQAVSALSQGFYNNQNKIFQSSFSLNSLIKEKEEIKLQIQKFYQEFYLKVGKEQLSYLKETLEYFKSEEIFLIKDMKEFCMQCLDAIYIRYINEDTDISRKILKERKRNILDALSYTLLKDITLSYSSENIWSNEFDEKKLSHNISKAITYIRKHFHEPINLEQIALEVNLNPEYLSRIFKEETGQSYSTFLTNLRMKKAENLLINTTDKVQNIAESIGYSNVSYFSTIFKKRYGLNPYEFRRINKRDI